MAERAPDRFVASAASSSSDDSGTSGTHSVAKDIILEVCSILESGTLALHHHCFEHLGDPGCGFCHDPDLEFMKQQADEVSSLLDAMRLQLHKLLAFLLQHSSEKTLTAWTYAGELLICSTTKTGVSGNAATATCQTPK